MTDQAAPLVLRAEGQGRHEETRRLWGNHGTRLLVEKARQREGKGSRGAGGSGSGLGGMAARRPRLGRRGCPVETAAGRLSLSIGLWEVGVLTARFLQAPKWGFLVPWSLLRPAFPTHLLSALTLEAGRAGGSPRVCGGRTLAGARADRGSAMFGAQGPCGAQQAGNWRLAGFTPWLVLGPFSGLCRG